MTTKFLTTKFANFPDLIVMDFPTKKSVWEQSSLKFPPPDHLENTISINIVVSASLIF